MPTPKQMEKLGAADAPEYWDAVLRDASVDAGPPAPSIRTSKLSQIARRVLRVSSSRCGRTVEIQKADAVRLYGTQAVWKDCAQRLRDDTCRRRTGRHEEDRCWSTLE